MFSLTLVSKTKFQIVSVYNMPIIGGCKSNNWAQIVEAISNFGMSMGLYISSRESYYRSRKIIQNSNFYCTCLDTWPTSQELETTCGQN